LDKKAFAECMKRNREKQNISIEELAEKIGISVDKLMEFESGDFVKIKASEIRLISDGINVPMYWLFTGGGHIHLLHRDENGRPYGEWIDY